MAPFLEAKEKSGVKEQVEDGWTLSPYGKAFSKGFCLLLTSNSCAFPFLEVGEGETGLRPAFPRHPGGRNASIDG
jgi:hypothetical protein